MLGAIIGDVVGSRFEFANHRSESFILFHKDCFFTDDTVMTCAVADCLVNLNTPYPSSRLICENLKRIGRHYPGAGYGLMFRRWLFVPGEDKPYDSFGNGAAMRISSVGWVAKSEEEVKKLSKIITGVSHNHEEGLKGAEVVAMCIYKLRNGATKHEIFKYARTQYPLINILDLDELRDTYYFNETCQNTVPQAIFCFLMSESFEDCLRKSVSIGGDTDTLCAISCALAEAYYGIPEKFKKQVLKYFDKADRNILLKPIQELYEKVGMKNYLML